MDAIKEKLDANSSDLSNSRHYLVSLHELKRWKIVNDNIADQLEDLGNFKLFIWLVMFNSLLLILNFFRNVICEKCIKFLHTPF